MKKDGRLETQKSYRLVHQVLCITAINFHRKSLIGYVELTINPLRPDLKRIRLNSKQTRLYRVLVNDTWEATFWYNDPSLEVCQDEAQDKQKSLDVYEKSLVTAITATSPEMGNGEVTIKLPNECQQLLTELQPLRINIEFSLESPDGGVHFAVPDIEGSLAEKSAHMFSYRHENSARLWFPCIDSFAEPCTWKLEFTCDLDMVAVSCGDLLEVVYTSDRRHKTYHYYLNVPTAAPNIALAVGPFEMLVDPNMHEVTHFCLPHLKGILKHTTSYLHESFEFFEELMSSRYPYSCYKQVFVDESYEELQSFATMSIFSTNLLHSSRVIDQTFTSRKLMAGGVARQFFGSFIAMQSWCDAWLTKGISSLLTGLFVKKTFGNNEYRHYIATCLNKIQDFEAKTGGIILDPSIKETQQYFSILQPHTISPAYLQMYERKAFLVLRMLEHRIGPTLLLQVFNKLLALASSASTQKLFTSWSNMLISTGSFLKIISTVTGKDIQPFIDQWVTQSGCAKFFSNFVFNRKRNVVELEIKQDNAVKGALKYVGPLEVTIQELDGSFNHTFNIEENKTKFEITCHSKSRRNKKKKIPLMTGEEVDMDLSAMDADSPVLWLRLDPGMNLLRSVTMEQPDYMWQYQLKYERDVVAQSEAILALQNFTTPATRKALTDVLECEQAYYKVRIESSMCLAKVANAMVSSWAGPPAMLTIFRKMFGSHSCPSIIRQNNFSKLQHYFILKAIPLAMAQLRNVHNICPPEVVRFLLDLFKYNDNSKNKYGDNYYRSALIDALAATITPAVTTVTITGQSLNADLNSDTKLILEEITRCLNLEKLLPCYRHTVTVSCLRAIRTLQKFGHVPSEASFFRSYAEYGVFRDVRIVAIEALVDFIKTDVNVSELFWLLDLIEKDQDKFVRYEALQLLCNNPPFRRGDNSMLNTPTLVEKLWNLINCKLAADSKLRCGVADLYFEMFGKFRPSCLHVPDNFMVFNTISEKKPTMINPAIVSETMTDMFEDDDDEDKASLLNIPPATPALPSRLMSPKLDEPIIDVCGNPSASESESPMAGSKRKAESPPGHGPLAPPPSKMLAMSEFSLKQESVGAGAGGDDSSSVRLKIKIGNPGERESKPIIRQMSADSRVKPAPSFSAEFLKFSRTQSVDDIPPRTPMKPELFSMGDSCSRLSEDSNSSHDDSSLSRPALPSITEKPMESLTSFHGLFSSTKSTGAPSTPSLDTAGGTGGASGHQTEDMGDKSHGVHRVKKKKKKNKHKKHKHKHERERSKDRIRERGDSMSVSSPMVPSVQSVTSMTSMSSLDNTRDSAPSSPEFEVI